ncbi:YfgM family protein [Wohlfahrtiimonas larvae]|uniref:Ancillary SecYEG translocon subunit n=1 Tax=Wohlfahrtiimonas larvae TaxID=1157986 RepID=A0ABP9MGR2_9GAMM|nr:tetratricopeptide repeat protein [Wohlfahrtiimonas larvae]
MSLNQFETDEQRAEALVDWLKANGVWIFLSIVIVIGGIIGWDYYKGHKSNRLSTQATNYYIFEQALESGKLDDKAIAAVMNDTKAEGFKDLAMLQKAAFQANDNDLKGAIADLQSQLSVTKDPVMKDLFRYRLAVVLYENKDYTASMTELNQIVTKSLTGLVKSLQGDIYVKEGRIDNAKAVYIEAFDILQSSVIQRKINQLSTGA